MRRCPRRSCTGNERKGERTPGERPGGFRPVKHPQRTSLARMHSAQGGNPYNQLVDRSFVTCPSSLRAPGPTACRRIATQRKCTKPIDLPHAQRYTIQRSTLRARCHAYASLSLGRERRSTLGSASRHKGRVRDPSYLSTRPPHHLWLWIFKVRRGGVKWPMNRQNLLSLIV